MEMSIEQGLTVIFMPLPWQEPLVTAPPHKVSSRLLSFVKSYNVYIVQDPPLAQVTLHGSSLTACHAHSHSPDFQDMQTWWLRQMIALMALS